jgi:hypothetical protein
MSNDVDRPPDYLDANFGRRVTRRERLIRARGRRPQRERHQAAGG